MNVVFRNGSTVVDFECHEGSHVFLKDSKGEVYKEWHELTPEETLKYTALRDTLSASLNII